MKIKDPPEYILAVLYKLTREGFAAFVVGGSVRDAIMCLPIKDWDIATSATPTEIAELFPKTVMTGEKFGTVTVVLHECTVEVTTFRIDGEYNDGRHPESVEFSSELNEDLRRRDFTINAMALSADGEIIDPFDGIKDIKDGIIRCVGRPGARFAEDALRMFRAFRFSAVLGFAIESETLQAICENARFASAVSAERIQVELDRILLSQKPEMLGEMIRIGLLEKYVDIPEEVPQGFDKLSCLPEESALRWGALCAILLEANCIKSVKEMLYTLRCSGKTIENCLRALKIANCEEVLPTYMFNDRVGIKRLLSENDATVVRCAAAINDVLDASGNGQALQKTDEVLASGECANLSELALSGKDLVEVGHPQGREIGGILKKLLEHVIINPQDNNREVLIKLVDRIME